MTDAEIKSRLVPGVLTNKYSGENWVPAGQCDGVIFFGERKVAESAGQAGVIYRTVTPSKELAALKYLQAATLSDRALYNIRSGVCDPKGILGVLATAEMRAAAAAGGVPLRVLFTHCYRGIHAMQPEHILKWRAFPVEEGVWAVLYIDESEAA